MEGSIQPRGAVRRIASMLVLLGIGCIPLQAGIVPLVQAEAIQVIEVTIKDYVFVTRQVPLQLNTPTRIEIRNEDTVRHDFGSMIFDGALTRVESDGVISYGRGIAGVFVDPARGATIQFTIDRPGKYEFRCSIHKDMKGEILLMSVGAV